MSDEYQCGVSGPGNAICTRTTSGHDTHTCYIRIDGQLTHVSWFDCNPIGEPEGNNDE